MPGELAWFGLEGWWNSMFTSDERRYIESRFQPMGISSERPLTQGTIYSRSGTPKMFLTTLAGWFKSDQDRHVAWRMIDQAGQVAGEIVDEHFRLGTILELATLEGNVSEANRAARDQVAIQARVAQGFRQEYPEEPLPCHAGYSHLVWILARQGQLEQMQTLAVEARSAGWQGFDNRIIENIRKSVQEERRRSDGREIRAQAKARGISTKLCKSCRHPMLPEMTFCSNCGAARVAT